MTGHLTGHSPKWPVPEIWLVRLTMQTLLVRLSESRLAKSELKDVVTFDFVTSGDDVGCTAIRSFFVSFLPPLSRVQFWRTSSLNSLRRRQGEGSTSLRWSFVRFMCIFTQPNFKELYFLRSKQNVGRLVCFHSWRIWADGTNALIPLLLQLIGWGGGSLPNFVELNWTHAVINLILLDDLFVYHMQYPDMDD